MNKLFLLAITFAILSNIYTQDVHNGTGFNYTNAYAYIRLQNYSVAINTTQFSYDQFLVLAVTHNIKNWKDNDILVAKYYNESYNNYFTQNISGFSNDMYVQKLNLSDSNVFSLNNNNSGVLTIPFDFWMFKTTTDDQKFPINYDQTYSKVTLNASIPDQVFTIKCNATVQQNIDAVFYLTFTVSLPRLVNVTDANRNYQVRLSLNESVLSQYQYFNQSVQPLNKINFEYLEQFYQNKSFSTQVNNPKDQFQKDNQCNISTTVSFQNNTFVDPCFAVWYEGAKSFNRFVQVYFCANNLQTNNLNSSNSKNLYYSQAQAFLFTYIEEQYKLTVQQLVSSPQQIVAGYDLHACALFANLLNFRSLMAIVMIGLLAIFN